jgi:hypothetical protein
MSANVNMNAKSADNADTTPTEKPRILGAAMKYLRKEDLAASGVFFVVAKIGEEMKGTHGPQYELTLRFADGSEGTLSVGVNSSLARQLQRGVVPRDVPMRLVGVPSRRYPGQTAWQTAYLFELVCTLTPWW